MSDFLTALAARTLGTAKVVLPRQPSRYERESPGAEPALREEEQSDFSQPDIRSEHPASTQQRDLGASRSEGESPTNNVSVSQSANPTPPRPGVPIAARANISHEHANNIAADVPRVGQPAADRRNTPQRDPSVLSRGQPQALPTNSLRARIPDRPRERIDSTPTVHVTIGRVEVRAIHRSEPAPAARKTPETPRLSLGAYLRQRRA
jgi:hypothetical protein